MQLAVVGTRSGMPEPGEPSSGYVVRTAETVILLDCGPGVAGALPAIAAPADLDAVFLSHLHLDHCHDLLPVAKKIVAPYVPYPGYPGTQRQTGTPVQVPLFVSPGGKQALLTLQRLFPTVSAPMLDQALELAFDITEYDARTSAVIGDCAVTAFPVPHAVPAWGVRVESPSGILAYTGDTGWSEDLVELAKGADLLLCEATRREPDRGPHGHLSATQAGQLARLAGVGELILTHFSTCEPTWLRDLQSDASLAFGGPVQLAAPASVFEVAGRERKPAMKKEVQIP
jgi:ribonuclease BN (tRNA processing enzyme)